MYKSSYQEFSSIINRFFPERVPAYNSSSLFIVPEITNIQKEEPAYEIGLPFPETLIVEKYIDNLSNPVLTEDSFSAYYMRALSPEEILILENISEVMNNPVYFEITLCLAESIGSMIGLFDLCSPKEKSRIIPLQYEMYYRDSDRNYKVRKSPLLSSSSPNIDEGSIGSFNANVSDLVWHLRYLYGPAKWIVSCNPLNVKRRKRDKKMINLQSRPTFNLLSLPEIRKRYNLAKKDSPSSQLPVPRYIRGHNRRLMSDYYKLENRGKIITVDSVWTGPNEASYDGCKYIVHYDK